MSEFKAMVTIKDVPGTRFAVVSVWSGDTGENFTRPSYATEESILHTVKELVGWQVLVAHSSKTDAEDPPWE